MKAYVSEDCINCGICMDLCPEIFEKKEDKVSVTVDPIPVEKEACTTTAAEQCPMAAIHID